MLEPILLRTRTLLWVTVALAILRSTFVPGTSGFPGSGWDIRPSRMKSKLEWAVGSFPSHPPHPKNVFPHPRATPQRTSCHNPPVPAHTQAQPPQSHRRRPHPLPPAPPVFCCLAGLFLSLLGCLFVCLFVCLFLGWLVCSRRAQVLRFAISRKEKTEPKKQTIVFCVRCRLFVLPRA